MQYDGIMNVVDMFSKRLIPIPVWEAAKAEVMAEQFYRSVVCNRGVMTSMVSDRDSRFSCTRPTRRPETRLLAQRGETARRGGAERCRGTPLEWSAGR